MTSSENKGAPGGAAAGSLQEIRDLEAKLVSLKKELILGAAAIDDGAARALSFLLMRIGDALFAAPINQVEEVVELPALAPLQDKVRTVAGLCNYHGQMLAVIDVAELAGGARSALAADRVLVVCSVPPRAFALLVDEAIEVIAADAAAVTVADEVMTGVLRAAGVLRLADNRTAQILNLAWVAVGAQFAAILSGDAATPTREPGA